MIAIACALVTLNGCAWRNRRSRQRAAQRMAEATAPQLIGTIALVNEDGHFVLIDNGSRPTPPTGAALKTFTGGAESAVLTVGSVRRPPFVVADIVKGAPKKGDDVFQ
jgi:hypothetical protein